MSSKTLSGKPGTVHPTTPNTTTQHTNTANSPNPIISRLLEAESLMDGYFTCTRRVWRPRKDADSWIHSKIRQVCYGNLAESHWAGVRLQRDDPGGWWTRAEAESGWTPADAGWWIHQPVEQQCAFNTPKLDWRAQGYGEVRMSTGDFFELHDLNSPVRQNVCT